MFGSLIAFVSMSSADAAPVSLAHTLRVRDAFGQPVSGLHDVRLSLYDTEAAASPLWTRSWSVELDSGVATVVLDVGDGAVPVDAQWFADAVWLGVTVDTGPELAPRTAIADVPVAAIASHVPVQTGSLPGTCANGAIAWHRPGSAFSVCDQGVWHGAGGSGGPTDDVSLVIAANGGISRVTHGGRLVDGFSDVTGLDLSNSVNLVRMPEGYVVGGTGGVDVGDLVPATTSNTNVVYSSFRSTEYPWYAFDDSHLGAPLEVLDRFWGSASGPSYPQFIGYDFGAGNSKIVTGYTIRARQDCCTNANPKDWEFQGSNNGSTWSTLHVGTYNAWGTSGPTNLRSHTFANTTAYRYYRLNIVANGGHSDVNVGQLELLGAAFTPGDLVAQGQPASTGTAQPTADLVVLLSDGAGVAALGSDVKAWISRNGSSFTEVPLTVEGTFGANGRIAAARDVDLSLLPSGTALTWKVTTHNQGAGNSARLHGVALSWP